MSLFIPVFIGFHNPTREREKRGRVGCEKRPNFRESRPRSFLTGPIAFAAARLGPNSDQNKLHDKNLAQTVIFYTSALPFPLPPSLPPSNSTLLLNPILNRLPQDGEHQPLQPIRQDPRPQPSTQKACPTLGGNDGGGRLTCFCISGSAKEGRREGR